MARASFGGGVADFIVAAVAAGDPLRPQSGLATFWDAETAGTQYTDLLLEGDPVDAIPVGDDGQVPTFQGPDGVVVMWAEVGGGSRVMVDAAGYIATLAQAAAEDAEAARLAAVEAQEAAEAVGATSDAQVAANVETGPLTGAALSASYAVRGETLNSSDSTAISDRAKLQDLIDQCIADGYKTIVVDWVPDLTGTLPVQTLTIGGTGLTSFTLTYDGQTTASISASATAAQVKTALEALSNIAVNEVAVVGDATTGYQVRFQGTLAETGTVMTASPTGGTGTVTISAAAVSIDKVHWYDRDRIVITGAGGGIRKDDSGAVFTSATRDTGDVRISALKFFSVAGTGTTLLDADRLIRSSASFCEFTDWDHFLQQTVNGRVAQSMDLHFPTVIRGAGAFVRFRESYDCALTRVFMEDRTAKSGQAMLVENTDGTMTGLANRNLRMTHPIVENCAGVPIRLAMCAGSSIDGLYTEANGAATDPQIDLSTLTTLSGQSGLTISGCTLFQTSAQKAAYVGAILHGSSAGTDMVNSLSNITDGGVLHEFGNTSGLVFSSGDRVFNAGLLTYPGQYKQLVTPGTKATTTAARPKSPKLYDRYFDTDLGRPITPTADGVRSVFSLRFTAGASSSGNLTITLPGGGGPYTVAVTAGDTITQVRDKVIAAATQFRPYWSLSPLSTNLVVFTATERGALAATQSFSAASTGVTEDYFGRDQNGSDPAWQVPATKTEVDAAAVATSPFGFTFTTDPRLIRGTADPIGAGGANQGVYMRVRDGASVSKIGLHVLTSSGNISVAVYSNSGSGRSAIPGTRLATSGAVACPATGYREISLGATVTVSPGDWIAVSFDNTTAKIAGLLQSTAVTDLGLGAQLSQNTAHPLPATPSSLSAVAGYTFVLIGVP